MKKYVTRAIEKKLKKAARNFPVVILTGMRQTGKSTLLKHLFPAYTYLTLDYPNIRQLAKIDPELFLDQYGKNLIIDEVQYAPELLQYIKIEVDNDRDTNGLYILTGSQYFPLMQGVTESLAGRASIHNLYGFSIAELQLEQNRLSVNPVFELIHKGFFPDPAVHNVDLTSFYGSYLQSYLERDIRQLLAVHDLSLFHNFIELLAARVGSLLNLNNLAKECGISFTTARKWLSLLESTQIVYLLRPYFKNITKRVIKSQKLYFSDSGMLASILRYQSPETLLNGPMAGNIFENFIVVEMLKQKANYSLNFELYFFRDSNHNEIDLIVEYDGKFTLAEIKMAKTLKSKFGDVLKRISPLFPNSNSVVLSFDTSGAPLSREIQSVHWNQFIQQFTETEANP